MRLYNRLMYVYYKNPRSRGRDKAKARKNRKIILTTVVLVASSAFGLNIWHKNPTSTTPVATETSGQQKQSAKFDWPTKYTAVGTLKSGVVASSETAITPRPIASMAKIITALAILEKAPLKQGEKGITIVFDEEDARIFAEYQAKDGAVTPVEVGKSMNQYEALQAMLLPSSNNVTDSLVRRVFGSTENYTKYANNMIKKYNLKGTVVSDASGFLPNTVSTPSDMVIVTQMAMKNPVIAEITAQKEANIPVAGKIKNGNRLLHINPAVVGGKPGNTDEAGWCLLFVAKIPDKLPSGDLFIGVVMDAKTPDELFDMSQRLIDQAPKLNKY